MENSLYTSRVAFLDTYPHYPNAVALVWRVVDEYIQGDYLYWVERSGSPEGPFESVHTLPILNTNEWVHQDQTVEILSKQVHVYYRIKVQDPAGRTFYSNPISLYRNLERRDWFKARKINHQESIRLRKVGIPVLVYKKIHWGQRCSCIDPSTNTVLDSACRSCYGTGYTGGFYPPILIKCEIVAQAQTPDLTDSGLGMVEDFSAQVRAMNYPLLTRDDMLIEMDSNVRWAVWTQEQLEWKRVPVIQQGLLKQIPPGSVRYMLEAPKVIGQWPTPDGSLPYTCFEEQVFDKNRR